MKSKHKKSKHKGVRPKSKIVIRNYEETPLKYRSKIDPMNLEEHKHEFLHHGHIPHFQFRTSVDSIHDISCSKKGQIKFDLLPEATHILECVREEFGCGDRYLEQMYGAKIEVEEASNLLAKYLKESGSEGMMTISWSKDLSCSGQMSWHGPCLRYNKPEARKYSMWIKNSDDNMYLREHGIRCLANHEIATHFYRSLNDGLQPWFSNRQRFGLSDLSSQALTETEEGLASVNTVLQANKKYLFSQALTYYTACKATEMTFHELFDHLNQYLVDKELRWKYVMRVKRCLQDPGGLGGYGKDQCYFTGAVDILRNIDTTDFHLLYSGKVSREEIPRIKRMARLDFIKLPTFLHNQEGYRKQLRTIAAINGLMEYKRSKKSSNKLVELKKPDKVQWKKTPQPPSTHSKSSSFHDFHSVLQSSPSVLPHSSPSRSAQSRQSTKTNGKHTKRHAHSTKKQHPHHRSEYTLNESDNQPLVTMIHISKDEATKDATVTPSQTLVSWWSSRSSSPAGGIIEDPVNSSSPVPYSPHRWLLRRRNRCSPNVVIKMNGAKNHIDGSSFTQ